MISASARRQLAHALHDTCFACPTLCTAKDTQQIDSEQQSGTRSASSGPPEPEMTPPPLQAHARPHRSLQPVRTNTRASVHELHGNCAQWMKACPLLEALLDGAQKQLGAAVGWEAPPVRAERERGFRLVLPEDQQRVVVQTHVCSHEHVLVQPTDPTPVHPAPLPAEHPAALTAGCRASADGLALRLHDMVVRMLPLADQHSPGLPASAVGLFGSPCTSSPSSRHLATPSAESAPDILQHQHWKTAPGRPHPLLTLRIGCNGMVTGEFPTGWPAMETLRSRSWP
eukprot:1846035-Rhodomonas_salina.3